MSEIQCDICVVGAGIAGWTAALRAAQLGAAVLVLDKSAGELGGGNTLMTSGSYRAAGLNARSASAGDLYRQIMQEGIAFPDLAKAWAESCARSVEWLKASGLEMIETPQGMFALEPYSEISFAPVYKKDVGSSILRKLKSRFNAAGGRYGSGVQARNLIFKGARVQGISAQQNGEPFQVKSKAVILATGGFSANKDLLARHIGPHAGECKLRGSPNDTGDGLRMALEVGAKAANLNYFYGHLISLKALTDDRFWPYPRIDGLLAEGVLVNRSGTRFMDEARGDVAAANEVARSDDVTGVCLIFDEAAWNRAKGDPRAGLPRTPPPNPWLADNDGLLYRASDAGELAKKISIDPTALMESVRQFNRACASGGAEALRPKRTGPARPLVPPYYGLKVVPGITFTMGGPLINGRGEVVDAREAAIGGLYAAGDVIGGLMGGFNGGYTGGLAQAVVTGLLAAESAAAYAKLA